MVKTKKWQQVFCPSPTPIEDIGEYLGVKILIKRDDLNHKVVQGNKLRKLKYNVKHAIENNFLQLATFGGAWSNHIAATAQAAHLVGMKSIGFIRGNELENCQTKWSNTLKQASETGMRLFFLSRAEYRKKSIAQTVLKTMPKDTYLIPEGGSNSLALQGVREVIYEMNCQIPEPTHIITACGTAGTMAGLIDGVASIGWNTKVIGIPVLKGAGFLVDNVNKLSEFHKSICWQLYFEYHAGGYAKTNDKITKFAQALRKEKAITLDKIYTSKAFFAAYDLIKRGEIQTNSRIVILHTGGLQGGCV